MVLGLKAGLDAADIVRHGHVGRSQPRGVFELRARR